MLVLDALQLVYVAAPKTASTSLHVWLSKIGGIEWAVGDPLHHSMDIPQHAVNYLTFTTWRDPVDRAVSLWQHFVNDAGPSTFPEFLEWVRSGCANPFYSWSQRRWTESVRLDVVIEVSRVHTVRDLLPSTLEVPQIPCLNTTTHDDPLSYYNDEIMDTVRSLYSEDFEGRI